MLLYACLISTSCLLEPPLWHDDVCAQEVSRGKVLLMSARAIDSASVGL